MILVTGAAGKTGLAALAQLSRSGVPLRAWVHKEDYARAVRAVGAQEVMVGDLHDPGLIERAMSGVDSVYHIPPNVHPDEYEIGRLIITQAQRVDVDLFVYHSVLHPQVEAMPHHWQKMRVEELLFASGLDFTILQPTAYVQNLLGQWNSIEADAVFEMPYPVETRLSLVDLQDVAEAAAIVLTRDGHRGAIYELVGTSALNQLEIASLLGELLDKEIQADTISINAWKQNAIEAGLNNYAVETLGRMFEYYASYGFGGNPNVLGWILGRPPTSFKNAMERELHL